MTDLLPKGYLIALKDDGKEDFKYTVKTEKIYIGGGTDCDIRLRNEDIIGRRCVIKLESSNRIIIQSLKKEHPVLVNNKELNDREYVLKPGDVIRIFSYNFRWENPDKSKEDENDCGHTSLIVDEIGNSEEQRRYSAPNRLEFESARDNDTFSFKNGSVSFSVDHEKKNLSDLNASKIVTKTRDEGSHILEYFDIPQEPPFDITPKKGESTHVEQHFGEKTTRSFGETYHSTPKDTMNTNQQKESSLNPPSTSSNDIIESLLDVSESPAKLRDRRSTGTVPFVGTPSHVYRVTRNILTPVSKPRLNAGNESCIAESNLFASGDKFLSECKSTPLKSRKSEKSLNRESIIHSPIIEDYALEKTEENLNENESKYKFVASRHRKHFRASNIAIENRIVEERESSRDENEDDMEGNLVDSIYDDSQEPMSACIIVNGDTKSNTYENLEVDSIYLNADSIEPSNDTSVAPTVPKSILTPLSKSCLLNKEKSAKKVTFARSRIQKSTRHSSWNSATFKDSRDSLSDMYNVSGDTENASLESFCRNEELYLPDRSQSKTSISTPCSTPVKGKRILMTLNGDVLTGPKTQSQVSSCSITYSASISTDDVDLTGAEKMESMEGSYYDVNARLSAVSNNLTHLSRSMKSYNLEEGSNVRESALSNNLTVMNFTNLKEGESSVRQSAVSNNLTPYSNSTNVSSPIESESSIPKSAESNNLIPSQSNSVDVEKSVRQPNNLNSASKLTNKSKLEMSEANVRQSNNVTSASKSMNVSNTAFEASVSQFGASNTLTPSKSLNWSTNEGDEATISKNLPASKSMNVSALGKKYITCQSVLSNILTPRKSMNLSNLGKRKSNVNHSTLIIPANISLNVSNLEEDKSSVLQAAVSSNNVTIVSKSMDTSNIEEQNSSVCRAAVSNILISSKSRNLSTIEEDEASISEFVILDNTSPSKSMNSVIEEVDGTPLSEQAVSDHESPSKSMNLSIEEKYDTPISDLAVLDNASPKKSMNLSIIEEVKFPISEPPVTNNLTISNESMTSIRILPKKLSIASNVSVTESDETVVDIQDITSFRSSKALPSDSKTDEASENTESVSEETLGSLDVPQIIVNEFVDSNENTVSVEHFTMPIEQDQEVPATEESTTEEPTTPVSNYENVSGMKRMFKTPCESQINYNVEVVQRLMETLHQPASSYKDFKGIQELMKMPKISVPGPPEYLTPVEKPSHSDSVVAESKIVNISPAGLPPSEYDISSKFITSFQADVSDTGEAKPFSSIMRIPQYAMNDSEITPSMKLCTDFDSAHGSRLLPCTSTPHHNIKNFLEQNSSLRTESQLVSEISGMCPSSSENEIYSQAACNPPDVAMLESDRLISQESSSLEKRIRGSWVGNESNANETLIQTTHNVNSKRFDDGSQPTSEILLIHFPKTYEVERPKEDVIPVTDETFGTQEAETLLECVKRIFIKPPETTLHLENAQGMREMFRTPRKSTVSYENVEGMKQMFKTPAEAKASYENVAGVKQMFKTPAEHKSSYENVEGMKQMFKTPAEAKSSYENVAGVKQIFKTPAELKSSYVNVSGMKTIFKTPLKSKTNYSDVSGMEELLRTPDAGVIENSSAFEECAWKRKTYVPEMVESFITVVRNEVNGTIDGIEALPESPTCLQDERVTDAVSLIINEEGTQSTINSTDSTDTESENHDDGISENKKLLNMTHRKVVLPRTDLPKDCGGLHVDMTELRSNSRKSAQLGLDAADEKSATKRAWKDLNNQENKNIFNKVDERTPNRRSKRMLVKKEIERTSGTTLKKLNVSGENKVNEEAQAMTQLNEQSTPERKSSVHLKNIENVYTMSPMNIRPFKESNDNPVLASSPSTVTRTNPSPIMLSKAALAKFVQVLPLEEGTTERNDDAEPPPPKIRVSRKKAANKEDLSRGKEISKLNSVVTRNVRRISSLQKCNQKMSVKGEVVLSPLTVPSKHTLKKIQPGVTKLPSRKRNVIGATSSVAETKPKRNVRGKPVQQKQIEKKTESPSEKPKRAARSNKQVEETVSQRQPKKGKAKVKETVPHLETSRPKRGKSKVEEIAPQLENSRPKRGKAKLKETVPQFEKSRPKRGKAKVEETVQNVETIRSTQGKAKVQEFLPESSLSTITKAEIIETVKTEKGRKKTRIESLPKKEVTRSRKPVQEESPATKRVTRKRKVVETPKPSSSKTTRGKRNEIAREAPLENKSKAKPKKNETEKIEEAIYNENGKSSNTQNAKRSRKLVTFKTKKRKAFMREIVEDEPRTKQMKKAKSTENVETFDGKSVSAKERSVKTAKQRSRIRVSVVMKLEAPARVGWLSKNTKFATSKASSSSQKKVRFSVPSPVMRVTRSSTTRGNPVRSETSRRQ